MVAFVHCPHLGGIEVAYRRNASKPGKPTLLLLHSFCTGKELYDAQFSDPVFSMSFDLIALDEIGHGSTTGYAENLTFWDQAQMALELLDQLGIEHAYVMGTSQGGFIAARMALLQPRRILGLILAGTSLYSETTDHGSWDAAAAVRGFLPIATSDVPTPNWVLTQQLSEIITTMGLGKLATPPVKEMWLNIHQSTYRGDEGRRKFIMNMLALRDRDNLTVEQLASIQVPVLVAHGTEDTIYGLPLVKQWMKDLVLASPLQLEVIPGGHYLAASNPKQCNAAVLAFVSQVRRHCC